jgi:hypothetical protein
LIKSLLFTVVIITTNGALTIRLPTSVHQKTKELAVPDAPAQAGDAPA